MQNVLNSLVPGQAGAGWAGHAPRGHVPQAVLRPAGVRTSWAEPGPDLRASKKGLKGEEDRWGWQKGTLKETRERG